IYKEINKIQPDLIGISANFTPYFSIVAQIARLCKQYRSDIPVVVGGHHVSASPAETLLEQAFDFVIIGEGEATFCRLAQYIFEGNFNELRALPGLAFRENGEIRLNLPANLIDNLDSLKMPQYTAKSKMKMILTSRGCPKNCQFCSIHLVMGKKNRVRSVENVIEEMKYWVQQGIKQFDFEDDNLMLYQERAQKLLSQIIHHFGARKLQLSAMNGLSADHLNNEILELMALAGFKWLNLPLVSGTSILQKKLKRNQSYNQFLKIIEFAAQYDLKVVGYLILGLPEDTIENMLQDILKLAQLRLLLGPSIFYPPPGSEIYRYCIRKKYIQPYDYIKFRSTAVPVETENFTRVDIVTLFRLTRLINYLKELADNQQLPQQTALNGLIASFIDQIGKPIGHRLSRHEIGACLIRDFFYHQDFHGLRLAQKVGNQFYYEKIEYIKSKPILDFFRNNLPGTKLRGVCSQPEKIL
ncbi:B12-binding domain-containing radical SAM protein, partial [candidate division KSB1 bacterium]|nr:B12-binding domain-containing radical SAM protein [candidate division KSB1 bacterium]